MGDLLDRLWLEVINLNHSGANGWQARLATAAAKKERLAVSAVSSLKKIPAKKFEPLTRLGRFLRYESCFGTLFALSDPGVGKTAGLAGKLAAQQNGGAKSAFFKYLWESISPEDDGEWLGDLAKGKAGDEPFGDTGPAVAALLKDGAAQADLGLFCAWHRYDACLETLRLLEESGMTKGEEADGLYESLLSADPSGLEGRPGSWPVTKKKASGASPDKPLYQIRAVQSCAFSNDSRMLAVAGASGPVRLIEPTTGAEIRSCEGIKAHIYRIAFSPDDRQVAAGKIHNEITVCDSATGRLLARCKRTEDEISELVYGPGGEVVCSAWCNRIMVFNAGSGKAMEHFTVSKEDAMVNAMEFSPSGRELLAHWQVIGKQRTHVTIWSWKDRKQLLDIDGGKSYGQRVAWLSDLQFAVADRDTGVTVYDRGLGKMLYRFGEKDTEMLAVAPRGEQIILSDHDKLSIWNCKERKLVRQLEFDASEAAISNDGRYLVAANSRVAAVWNFPALLG